MLLTISERETEIVGEMKRERERRVCYSQSERASAREIVRER